MSQAVFSNSTRALSVIGEFLAALSLVDGHGDVLLRHACGFNLEGIVSKRRSSRYRSGRSDDWRKIKCPEYQRK